MTDPNNPPRSPKPGPPASSPKQLPSLPDQAMAPTQTPTSPPPPIFVSVNSNLLNFAGKEGESNMPTRNIIIQNQSNFRVAWRALSNYPRRYVVCPNIGFLGAQEAITLRVTMVDLKKYNRRHSFIVQAKKASEQENNRKMTWKKMSKEENVPIQNIRINTKLEGSKSSAEMVESRFSDSSISGTDTTSSVTTNSSASTGSVVSTDGKQVSQGALDPRINQLNNEMYRAMDEKKNKTTALVDAVNKVKQLEVDLDRSNNTVNEVTTRYNRSQYNNVELKTRHMIVKEELNMLKTMQRNQNAQTEAK